MIQDRTPPTELELRQWLVEYLARLVGVARETIDTSVSFEVHGLDSSGAVGLSGDLEDLLSARFETSLVYDHGSIDALVAHLATLGLVRRTEEGRPRRELRP